MSELRDRYEQARGAHPSCPTTEDIRRLMQGEIDDEEERLHLELHLNDCAACIELMERLEAAEPEAALDPAEEERLERKIARELGLREKVFTESPLRMIDWLWRVKPPLAVPAVLAAALVCVIITTGPLRRWTGGVAGDGRSTGGPAAGGIVHSVPVTGVIIDQAAVRSGEATAAAPTVKAGEILLVEVFLARLDMPPGAPVRYVVEDAEGRVRLDGRTAIREDLNVRVALRMPSPGTFTLRLNLESDESPLEALPFTVLP